MSPTHESWCLLDNFFSSQRPLFSLSRRAWSPPVDVSETPERILIRMEVSGMRRRDFSIVVERELLTVAGRRCDRPCGENEEFHAKEIHYGCFERTFRLPSTIQADGIEAAYRDGFLEITVPKGEGQTTSVRISLQED